MTSGAPENVGKIQRPGEIMLVINRAYTKHQDIHDQESFRKFGIPLFRTPESNPILCGHGLRY